MKILHDIDTKYLIRAWLILVWFIILQVWLSRLIGEERIAQRVESSWIRAPLVLIIYKTFSVIIAPLSGSVMYLIAWGLFGVRRWVIYGAIGNFFGMSFAYWVGREYWDKAVKRFVGEQAMKEVTHLLSHLQDKKTFVLSRVILMPLEDLINFASGMARLNYWWFISVSMIVVTLVSTVVIFLWDKAM